MRISEWSSDVFSSDLLVGAIEIIGPEIPLHVGVAEARVGEPFLAADEVRELHRIAHEENGRVVADQVVIALVGEEFEGEAAHVAPGVGAALLDGHRREAREHVGLRAGLEQGGLGIGRYVLGRSEEHTSELQSLMRISSAVVRFKKKN